MAPQTPHSHFEDLWILYRIGVCPWGLGTALGNSNITPLERNASPSGTSRCVLTRLTTRCRISCKISKLCFVIDIQVAKAKRKACRIPDERAGRIAHSGRSGRGYRRGRRNLDGGELSGSRPFGRDFLNFLGLGLQDRVGGRGAGYLGAGFGNRRALLDFRTSEAGRGGGCGLRDGGLDWSNDSTAGLAHRIFTELAKWLGHGRSLARRLFPDYSSRPRRNDIGNRR